MFSLVYRFSVFFVRLITCLSLLLLCSAMYSAPAKALPPGFQHEENVTGPWHNQPITLAFAPDGRLFICERSGRVLVANNGQVISTFHTISGVNTDVERGLLGIAFDPNHSSNRYLYLFYISSSLENRLVRVRASSGNANISDGSETVMLSFPGGQYGNHNGGAINFGPDNMLYVATGDQGTYFGADAPQRIDNLYGKLLRLNVSNYPNIIPGDNPYVGQPGSRGEIWSRGHRNPFTFDIDPLDGRVFVNDVGDGIEKIYHATRGSNAGWPSCFDGAEQWRSACNTSEFNPPIHTYDHSDGSVSVTGGAFYRAGVFPSHYNGAFFFSDWGSGWVKYITPDLNVHSLTSAAEGTPFGPLNMAVGNDGALYIVQSQGGVDRYSYSGSGQNRPPNAVMTASPSSGSAPLQVQFDSSGSFDPDGDSVSFSWNFGDGSGSASGSAAAHTYTSEGSFTAVLTVTDSNGSSATASRTITVDQTAPVLRIDSPAPGTTYRDGDVVNFSGSISDSSQGAYPADAYEWEILFGHDAHFHPFFGPQRGIEQGTVTLGAGGHTETNVYYRFILRLRPEYGTADPVIRDIAAELSQFTVNTTPNGLEVSVDGRPHNGSRTFDGVIGGSREISAPETQILNGRTYRFVSWSDGGERTHRISTPESPTTYTAAFQVVDPPPGAPSNLRRVP